jgi:spore coat polysaccharide biosynthesis protein SpsF (cytidylyltransferase family)
MDNIAICLLARTDSQRLPRKALLEIQGKPTIIHLANRLSKSEYPLTVCMLTFDILALALA